MHTTLLNRQKLCVLALPTREPAKRKRTEGLNSRFDRMIETVNVVRDSDREPRRKRRRTASSASGSSSLVGWDAPEVSLDAYNDLDGGRLGETFSTLSKNRVDVDRNRKFLEEFPYQLPIAEPTPRNLEEESHVPHWLTNTVSTLQSNHPLRGLIPAPPANPGEGQNEAPVPSFVPFQEPAHALQGPPCEEQVFAFRPPTASFDSADDPTRQPPRPNPLDGPGIIFNDTFASHDPFEPVVPPSSHHARPDQLLPVRSPSGIVEQHSPTYPPMSRQAATAMSTYIEAIPADIPVEIVPFSTPGPLVRSSKIQNPASRFAPPLAASASASILSLDDPPTVTPNDPLPFSKPGPLAPSVRIKGRPSPMGRLHSQNNNIPRFPKLLTPARALTPNSDSSDHFSLSDPLRSDSASSPTTNPPYPNTPYTGGSLRNTVALRASRFRSPSAPSKDLLTTPGPTHIYFDSPTEDPQTSDPIDPTDYELDLDYENLDFRWERFDPSGPPLAGSKDTRRFPHVSSDASHDQDGESVVNNQLPLKLPLQPGPAPQTPPRTNSLKRTTNDLKSNIQRRHEVSSRAPSTSGQAPSITNIDPPSDGFPEANSKMAPPPHKEEPFNSPPAHKSPAAPEFTPGPAFAPAPGIYISPLRSQAETVGSAERVEGGDGDGSAEQDVGVRPRSGVGRKVRLILGTEQAEARSHILLV